MTLGQLEKLFCNTARVCMCCAELQEKLRLMRDFKKITPFEYDYLNRHWNKILEKNNIA